MLETIQIITILQGLFLIIILWINRKKYKSTSFLLLVLTIVSVIIFVLGNDQNGFFNEPSNWFFFDSSFFITFLFLFVKYHTSTSTTFNKRDLLYFIPNIAYLGIESYENEFFIEGSFYIESQELAIELTFMAYLLGCIFISLRSATQKWIGIFLFPLLLIMGFSLVNLVLAWAGISNIDFFNNPRNTSYALVIIALLLYFITFKMIIAPSEIMHIQKDKKYRTSGLNEELIGSYSKKIIDFMEVEKGFMDTEMSLSLLSQKLKIPKQYISEILNSHLSTNFQDFINGYRVDDFIEKLNDKKYSNYTLLAIATQAGFNSKSSFYNAFKKSKGITPTEYRKSLKKQG